MSESLANLQKEGSGGYSDVGGCVGTWGNTGKPAYKKVITGTVPSTGTNNSYKAFEDNSIFIKAVEYCKVDYLMVPYVSAAIDGSVALSVYDHIINVVSAKSTWVANKPYEMVIVYTLS